MVKKKIRPPKKLSKAIIMAVDDLELVEKDKAYKVDMNDWHSPMWKQGQDITKYYPICEVCFAGSVMAKTLKSDPSKSVSPSYFYRDNGWDDRWPEVFDALDSVRHYNIRGALITISEHPMSKTPPVNSDILAGADVNTVSYEEDAAVFKDNMRKIAKYLKKEGW